MRMKRGTYYIACNKNDVEISVYKVSGWLIHDDVSKLDFGARYVDHKTWEVTELSSGSLASTKDNRPENKSDIIPFIERMRDTIVQAMESHQDKWFKMCKDAIKKAYEEDTDVGV